MEKGFGDVLMCTWELIHKQSFLRKLGHVHALILSIRSKVCILCAPGCLIKLALSNMYYFRTCDFFENAAMMFENATINAGAVL